MPFTRTLIIAVIAAVLPAAAIAAPNKPASTVSIAVSPGSVTFGKAATISGTTAPNTAVTLRADTFPFNNQFAQAAHATSSATGAYSFTVTPDQITHYRVDAKTHPAAQSTVATLNVRWKVTRTVSTHRPKKGSRVRFSGTVGPAHNGGTVELQRRFSTGYKTVKTATLAAATTTTSSYSMRIKVNRNGTYRVRVEADSSHLAGNSRAVTLRVR
jgi:hypothetical protein